MAPPVYANCLGLTSPVGLTPESACAAMRARIAAFCETPFKDNEAEPIVGAMVPVIEPGIRGRDRLVELLAHALQDVPQRLPEGLALGGLPVLLCTREADRPGCDLTGILTRAEAKLALTLRRDGARHFDSGTVAPFEALAHARQLFDTGAAEACLIIAVDSFMDARALHWLDRHQRLKKEGNPDGLIPGEAACATLVTKHPILPGALKITGLGFGQESATVFNDDPLLGRGMADAVRQALAEAETAMHAVAFRLSDVAGEAYAFEELVLAQVRNLTVARKCQDLLHPAGYTGDCGAANGLLQLAYAEQALFKRYACGTVALAHASAPAGARAAAVLTESRRER